ncbi:MAG: hypothetical protein ACRDTM_01130 [Micromonosporaceae bacterium]
MMIVDWQPRPVVGDGPVAIALSHSLCADSSFSCDQISLLAKARQLLPVPRTLLLVGSVAGWRMPSCSIAENPLGGSATVRAWLATGHGTTARQAGPVFYHMVRSAVEELVIEFGGIGGRESSYDPMARLVMSVQSFVPADVSVTATVERPGGPVRLRAHRGLDDDLGGRPERDVLVFSWPRLSVLRHEVHHQTFATVAADGGTRMIAVPPRLRDRPAMPVTRARAIARACARLAERLDAGLEFEIAVRAGSPYLLSCQRA